MCNEATVMSGVSKLITWTYLQLQIFMELVVFVETGFVFLIKLLAPTQIEDGIMFAGCH